MRGRNSEVSIETPDGMQDILCRKIHTDLSRHEETLPDNESLIGPSVQVQLSRVLGNIENQAQFIMKIPHCLQTKDFINVRVRRVDEKRNDAVHDILTKEQTKGNIPYFEVNSSHVIIHTNHFSEYVCSSSGEECLTSIMAFPFGCLTRTENISDVEVSVYLCCSLYKIQDFKTVSKRSYFVYHTFRITKMYRYLSLGQHCCLQMKL